MHRRRFIALLGGAITPPCVAAAQQRAMPVIGFLDDRTTIAFAGLVEREFGGFTPPSI